MDFAYRKFLKMKERRKQEKLKPGASSPGTKQHGDRRTNQPTDQPTDQPTNRRTKSLIEALKTEKQKVKR
jgi:hypothetical protein